MRYSSGIPTVGSILLIILLIGCAPISSSPDVWTPKATTSENNTPPTGLPPVTALENTGDENTAVISGAVNIVVQTIEAQENVIVTTRMPTPGAQSKDGVRVDNKDNLVTSYGFTAAENASIPYSENLAIPMGRVDNVVAGRLDNWYFENSSPVTLRGRSGWVFRVDNYTGAEYDDLYIRDPDRVWRTVAHYMTADGSPAYAGLTIGTSWSVDEYSFFFENFMFRHAENAVSSGAPPALAENITLYLRVDTWMIAVRENALRVDLDNDGTIGATDNLHAVIADNDSDGLMDLVYLSAGTDLVFDNQAGNDDVVTATGDNDENISLSGDAWSSAAIRIGDKYKFKIRIRENAPVSGITDDVSIIIDNYYTGILNVDVDDDGETDALNFCFVDDNSDGVYENIYISAFDDNFIEGDLADSGVSSDNDENLASTKNIRIGSYLYSVQGPNPPGQSDDISVFSLSRWFGNIYLDTDGDGNADNIVYFCLSDNDSDGIFNVLQISVNDNVFDEGTLDDNAYLDNDAQIIATDNVRIGTSASQSLCYLAEFDNSPDGTGYDFRVTSTSWYVGTITLHAGNTFNFVILDENSDCKFDNLVFDADGNGSYAGESHYSSYPAYPVWLPSSPYAYKVVWFNRNPAYSDATYGAYDLVMEPMDVASPAFSGASPTSGSTTNNTTPTISVDLSDVGTGGYTFGIESIVMKVHGQTVSHTYSGGVVSYTPSVGLSDGVVEVSVSASDYAKNSASTSWSFTIDTTVPTVTISPLLDATPTATGWRLTTTKSSIEISGSIRDATGVTVKINDKVVPVVGSSFSKTVNLAIGTNTFTLTITDAAGNSTTRTLSVTRAVSGPLPVAAPISLELVMLIVAIVAIVIVVMVLVKMVLVRKY